MSRYSNSWKWVALGVAGVGILGVVTFGPSGIRKGILRGIEYWKTDPYKNLRAEPNSTSAPAMIMPNVIFAMYQGAMKIGEGLIDRVEITKDRQILHFFGITKGRYFQKEGREFQFSGDRGQYHKSLGELLCNGNVHIVNKDLDLTTSDLRYQERQGLLSVDNPVQGKLQGGTVQMASFKYAVSTGDYEALHVKWKGSLGAEFQEGQGEGTNKDWDYDADSQVQKKNIVYCANVRATNGETLIVAPKMVYDREKKTYTFTDGVKMFGKDNNVACPKATVYDKEKKIMMEGGVSMLIKPKNEVGPKEEPIEPLRPVVPESISAARPKAQQGKAQDPDLDVRGSENKRKYPVKVFADTITYFYKKGNRHANISGHPQARQDFPDGGWRQIWCTTSYYDGEKKTLKLDGTSDNLVLMKNSIGDIMHTTFIILSTKEDDDYLETGKSNGRWKGSDDEDNGPSDTTPPPPLPGEGGTKPPVLPGVIKGRK